VIPFRHLDEAIDIANDYAPEHLCLLVSEPWDHIAKIRHAGGIFVGESSPEVIGDYTAVLEGEFNAVQSHMKRETVEKLLSGELTDLVAARVATALRRLEKRDEETLSRPGQALRWLLHKILARIPIDGPTTPRCSRMSISRPARAKPTLSLRWSIDVDPSWDRTISSMAWRRRRSNSYRLGKPVS
jgi:hypothetical protein